MHEMERLNIAQFLDARLSGKFTYNAEVASFQYERAHFVLLVPARKAFQMGPRNVRVKSQLLAWIILTDSVRTDGIEIISSKYESEISNNVFLDVCVRD